MGLDLLKRISEELKDIAQVDQEPSLEGRQLLMVLSPLKKSKTMSYKLNIREHLNASRKQVHQ